MKNFFEFINKAVTQYHAVSLLEEKLKNNGYIKLNEFEEYNIVAGGKYYVCRNSSSIIAFKAPNASSNLSMKLVASHTDSPTFKLKPNNKLVLDGAYTSLNTEVYGGPIYSSFFDRPLSLAGRAFIKTNEGIREELVNVSKDLLVIPNECIHFNREVNNGKSYNPQIDLLPLLGDETSNLDSLIKSALNLKKDEEIISHDLQIYSRYRGGLIGANSEYFLAPQIDNLESALATLEGFLGANHNDNSFDVWASFDNEEVGSQTKQGAGSRFLEATISRAFSSLHIDEEKKNVAIANGLLVSCDNAHAVHPNDLGKTDKLNKVYMNKGIVIKYNANQAYTTDALSSGVLKAVFKNNNISYQEFTNRSDVRGGGTLGAISLGQLSIASVDIGLPQLAMHSCVETAGVKDYQTLVDGMKAFFSSSITKNINGYNIK